MHVIIEIRHTEKRTKGGIYASKYSNSNIKSKEINFETISGNRNKLPPSFPVVKNPLNAKGNVFRN